MGLAEIRVWSWKSSDGIQAGKSMDIPAPYGDSEEADFIAEESREEERKPTKVAISSEAQQEFIKACQLAGSNINLHTISFILGRASKDTLRRVFKSPEASQAINREVRKALGLIEDKRVPSLYDLCHFREDKYPLTVTRRVTWDETKLRLKWFYCGLLMWWEIRKDNETKDLRARVASLERENFTLRRLLKEKRANA